MNGRSRHRGVAKVAGSAVPRGSRRAAFRRFALAALVALVVPAAASPVVAQEGSGSGGETQKSEETRPVIDANRVYYGAAETCRAPAVVDADRVYRAIPEYRKILDDRLTEKDPNYSMLLLKASRKFKKAVENAAAATNADLVAATGAVTWEGRVIPDITDTAVEKVAEAEKAAK